MLLAQQYPKHTEAIADACMSFIAEHHLEGMIPAIMRRLAYYEQQAINQTTAHITLSHHSPVAQSLIDSLTHQLGITDQHHIATTVDPQLLGGCVIVFDGKRYDFSLERQLERLQSSLTTPS